MELKSLWKQFIRRITVIISLFTIGMILGLFIKNNQLLKREVESRARSHFDNILLTRRWNANYHGLYVEKTEGVTSNPYLHSPDIVSSDGTVYTKKNPALMTREISELATTDSLYSFHITSLNPINPDNQADDFETNALRSFEKGEVEAIQKFKEDGKTIYRYMAPLVVEVSCLNCHAEQGYQEGDIRGGISVNIDITEIEGAQRWNNILIFILSTLSLSVLLILTYLFIRQLMKKIDENQSAIKALAVTDELTQLHNRRFFFEKLSQEHSRTIRHKRNMACIMMDIDFFKKFNDTYGHQVGDLVLKRVAQVLQEKARTTDTLARYGGEEFIVLLPETDVPGAEIFAEKMRDAVETEVITTDDNQKLKVAISLGVCGLNSKELSNCEDETVIVKYADQALSSQGNGQKPGSNLPPIK
jgi:diguanylate cyclase (GGDEF)-like protein